MKNLDKEAVEWLVEMDVLRPNLKTRTMKQTAVEWQFEQFFNSFEKFNNGECTFNDYLKRNLEILEQAKELEKEQHQETWNVAHQAGRFEGKGIAEENWQTFETYWEENL